MARPPHTAQDFALLIKELVGGQSEIVHLPATQDDPSKRRPDISIAKEVRCAALNALNACIIDGADGPPARAMQCNAMPSARPLCQ